MNIELSNEAKTNIWLGKGLLVFGIGFNAFLGFTVGYALLAFATATIVALFDLAKVRMVRNAVVSWRMNSLMWFFSGAWVVILTAASITSAVMFYAYSMSEVAKEAHRSGDDVQIAKQAFDTSQAQAKSVQGFDVLGTQQRIAQLESQAAAILNKEATNRSGRTVGNIGGRTDNCSGSKSYYAGKYAADCSQYAQLTAEARSLKSQIGTATTLQQNATQATNAALTAMGNFQLSEGIAGIGVLANMWYPDLYASNQKAAEQKAFKSLLIGVALITELLATSLLLYGYVLGTGKAPSPTNGARITGDNAPQGQPIPASAAAFNASGKPTGFSIVLDKVLSAFGEKPAPKPTRQQLTEQQKQANSEKWRKALEVRGIPCPADGIDEAMEQDASDETINNVLGEIPEPEKGLDNPLTEVDEKRVSEPLANRQNGLYEQWVQAVKSKECKPSVKPTWSWVQKRTASKETGKSSFHRSHLTHMQKAFFTRAMNDGLMKLNPNYTRGGKKYLWIGGYE